MALYELNDAQHATVLAALRYYQRDMHTLRTAGVYDIATNCGRVEPLNAEAVGQLCDSLNHSGLDFGDVVNLLGAGAEDPYVAAAHEHDLQREGTLEVDAKTIVSRGADDGAYVMAWLWVDNEDAGVGGEGDECKS